jgi:hypothetical protein
MEGVCLARGIPDIGVPAVWLGHSRLDHPASRPRLVSLVLRTSSGHLEMEAARLPDRNTNKRETAVKKKPAHAADACGL